MSVCVCVCVCVRVCGFAFECLPAEWSNNDDDCEQQSNRASECRTSKRFAKFCQVLAPRASRATLGPVFTLSPRAAPLWRVQLTSRPSGWSAPGGCIDWARARPRRVSSVSDGAVGHLCKSATRLQSELSKKRLPLPPLLLSLSLLMSWR